MIGQGHGSTAFPQGLILDPHTALIMNANGTGAFNVLVGYDVVPV
jgi:hypothetical protein